MTTEHVASGPGGRRVTIRSFDDIAGYEQSMRLATTSMVVREAPNFSGWHVRVDLGPVRLNSAEYAASLSTSSTVRWPRFFFLTGNGRPARVFGREFDHGALTFMAEQGGVSMVSDKHMAWTSIEFDPDLLRGELAAIDERLCERLAHGAMFAAGGTPAWRRLMELRRSILGAGVRDPAAFDAAPVAARAAGSLAEAVMGCVGHGAEQSDQSASGLGFVVLRRMIDAIEADEAAELTLAGLCQSAGVSVRTVHEVAMRYLGMPPGEYLRLRRLRRVLEMLRHAPPDSITVAAAMSRQGFWDLSRASDTYRRMFGEAPADTLDKVTRVAVTEPRKAPGLRKRA